MDSYTDEVQQLTTLIEVDAFSNKNEEIEIKNIDNHYYLPIIISKDAKIDFINHIISVKSEKQFLEGLENYVRNNKINVEYWFFSKIDEGTDKIYIPYYNKKYNKESKFFPDFIFWLKKGNRYYLVFIDPKGTEHTDYEYKVDGFKTIYEEAGKPRKFQYNGLIVEVFLYLYTEDRNKLSDEYRKYWFSETSDIFEVVNK